MATDPAIIVHVETPGDEALFVAFREGDTNAFIELFGRWKHRVYRYCLHMTGNTALAEDAFQDTFLRVVQYAHGFHSGREFAPWLFAIARNATLKVMARDNRVSEEAFDDVEEGALDPLLERDFLAVDALRHAIAQLPLALREPLLLAEFEGMPHARIAELVGISAGAVRVRVLRARRLLRDMLAPTLRRHER